MQILSILWHYDLRAQPGNGKEYILSTPAVLRNRIGILLKQRMDPDPASSSNQGLLNKTMYKVIYIHLHKFTFFTVL